MLSTKIKLNTLLCFLLGSLIMSMSSALAADKKSSYLLPDPSGLLTGSNLAADKISGYVMSEPSGCKVWDDNIKPGDTVTWNGPCSNGLAEGKGSGEWRWLSKIGENQYVRNSYYDVINMRAGKRHGYGESRHSNGDIYKGNFSNHVRNGQGEYRWPDGKNYNGQWKASVQDGQGTMLYSNGDKYVGSWKAGKKDGMGQFYYADGRVFEGRYKNGKRQSGNSIKTMDEETERERLAQIEADQLKDRIDQQLAAERAALKPGNSINILDEDVMREKMAEINAILNNNENTKAPSRPTPTKIPKPPRPTECDDLGKEVDESFSRTEDERISAVKLKKQADQAYERYENNGNNIRLAGNTLEMCRLANSNCSIALNNYNNIIRAEQSLWSEYESANRKADRAVDKFNNVQAPRYRKLVKRYNEKCEN